MIAVKKPIEVTVWQLQSRKELPKWVDDAWSDGLIRFDLGDHTWRIKTLEGEMKAGDGDYLIRGIRGELYPCERTIFEETYDIVRK